MKLLLKNTSLSIAIAGALLTVTGCSSSNSGSNNDNSSSSEEISSSSAAMSSSSEEMSSSSDEMSSSSEASSSSAAAVETSIVSELSTGIYPNRHWAYYDLDLGQAVTIAEGEDPADNSDWEVAFKGVEVALNSHVSLYYTGNAASFYDASGTPIASEFASADLDTVLADFEAFDGSTVPTDAEFVGDVTARSISDYYIYHLNDPDHIDHTVTANPDAKFIVRSDDTFSKFFVSNLTQAGFKLADLTLTIGTQAADADPSEFDMEEELLVSAADCTGPLYVDLDSKTMTTADGDWELSIACDENGASFDIDLAENADALFGPNAELSGIDPAVASHYTWRDTEYTLRAIVEHGETGKGYGWAEYKQVEGVTMSPNFSLFVVKTEMADYKFQILNYANSENVSGYYTFQYAPVTLPEAIAE